MKPLCIAHRGCHWHWFENTKEAFIAAAEGEYFGIEMDIHLTKDKKWIIHHDPDFLSNGSLINFSKVCSLMTYLLPLERKSGS